MDIIIRKAKARDLKAIQDLNHELFKMEHRKFDKSLICRWPYSKDGRSYFLGRIRGKNGFAVVAEVNGKVVGYLVGAIKGPAGWRKWKRTAEAENMLVLSRYRGRKIGTMLMKMFLSWCKDNKVENVKTVASYNNHKAIKFYRKLGFKGYEVVLEKNL